MGKSLAKQAQEVDRSLARWKQFDYRCDQAMRGKKRISVWIDIDDEIQVRAYLKKLADERISPVSANLVDKP